EGVTITSITLAHLLLALVILGLTIVAARNIPGLLEISLLQHLPLDRGIRFAISTLCRYVLIIIGVVMTAAQIGIGWARVQWLIAAMGVGLGFGLQEIFGNFVSGLIILFERPMRVGDTVTVGDVFGTVTQIRIRATTIQQWDRKELIVPNKEFITGQLINWTLSDTILRLEFPVGIAYGSDIDFAEKILLDIAHDADNVLDDPPPRVIFRSFGGSALQFELRLFIPDLDHYADTWHEINRKINGRFNESDITIAFPQQDVHLDLVDKNLPDVVKAQKSDGATD
ncbi:MAG: mechanosensitive ion channel domain-containing protein, partial [Planctomycetota bacterium]